ncbi:TPA: type I restriction endonuclease subunit R [Bacillus cereus]
MSGFKTTEKYVSQVPAMQALIKYGYECLPQSITKSIRGRQGRVLLEDILTERILEINSFTYKGNEYEFNNGDAEEAIRKLKPSPVEQRGLLRTNQDIYDLLILGTTIEKTIDGDKKSYSLRYIDWDNPSNNVYHATVEMSVNRVGSKKVRRCDIILFVNGIPFVVIENKAPTESVSQGVSQLIGYQNSNEIPQLFHYAQLLIATNKNEVKYGTVGSSKKYWLTWKDEEDEDKVIHKLINTSLTSQEKNDLFAGDFTNAKQFFEDMEKEGERAVTEQDRTLYALCRPERLLEIIRVFTVFDGGVRKVARYQQFFGVRQTLERIRKRDQKGRREGGVIFHTQGSGKSLTMVMLGRALAFAKDIKNPRILIATDRDDLDKQIKDTFKSCDMDPIKANTGAHLLELLKHKYPLVTTIINKFDTAIKAKDFEDLDPNLFVLVDESHRTQNGSFAAKMRRVLPNACYLGFTGTPLLKKEKNTFETFGGLIHKYSIDDAVTDKAVVPLLYEGRYVEQNITGSVIDTWFDRVSRGLTDEQKADLKKKFSRLEMLSKTEQTLYAKAMDISEHFRQIWQGTGRKAQLVAPSKSAAIRFKEIFDDLGHVSSEVIISPPDVREGNEDVEQASKDRIKYFWDAMMRKYGSEEEYNRRIISSFKGSGEPEILIVVSKLLTGFDAPRNTVLYICKQLKEHNLLQAVARVNRLFEEEGQSKQFGYIIDYEGLLGELDNALSTYSSFKDFDEEDLENVVHDIREILRQLPQLHQNLWDIFKEVPNKLDHEQMEQHLWDEQVREEFYFKLREFGRQLHTALSSEKTYDIFSNQEIEIYKRDWKEFMKLKKSVQIRYQEIVDMSEYEPKIAKLLDDHVIAQPAEIIIGQVNINDTGALESVLDESNISPASKADRIASATKKSITERLEEDPALYKAFSEMLEEAIMAYREKRISEIEYLDVITEIVKDITSGKREAGVPSLIREDADAQAFYGVILPMTIHHLGDNENSKEVAAEIASGVLKTIGEHLIVKLWLNEDAQKQMQNAIDDYFFDVVGPEMNIELDFKELDTIEQAIMDIARARFPG